MKKIFTTLLLLVFVTQTSFTSFAALTSKPWDTRSTWDTKNFSEKSIDIKSWITENISQRSSLTTKPWKKPDYESKSLLEKISLQFEWQFLKSRSIKGDDLPIEDRGKKVINSSSEGKEYFIPNKTDAEWNSFEAAVNAGLVPNLSLADWSTSISICENVIASAINITSNNVYKKLPMVGQNISNGTYTVPTDGNYRLIFYSDGIQDTQSSSASHISIMAKINGVFETKITGGHYEHASQRMTYILDSPLTAGDTIDFWANAYAKISITTNTKLVVLSEDLKTADISTNFSSDWRKAVKLTTNIPLSGSSAIGTLTDGIFTANNAGQYRFIISVDGEDDQNSSANHVSIKVRKSDNSESINLHSGHGDGKQQEIISDMGLTAGESVSLEIGTYAKGWIRGGGFIDIYYLGPNASDNSCY